MGKPAGKYSSMRPSDRNKLRSFEIFFRSEMHAVYACRHIIDRDVAGDGDTFPGEHEANHLHEDHIFAVVAVQGFILAIGRIAHGNNHESRPAQKGQFGCELICIVRPLGMALEEHDDRTGRPSSFFIRILLFPGTRIDKQAEPADGLIVETYGETLYMRFRRD
jgi:hypothetical protein